MRNSRGEKMFYSINNILLLLASLSVVFPLLNIIAVSFSGNDAIISGKVSIIPVDLTFVSYQVLVDGTNILQAFLNSIEITVIGIALCMSFTLLAAYPLSRKFFYGRKFFTLGIVFTMLFSGGVIPGYLLVKGLGLVNTYGALWLPGLISAFNMLVMKNYFENLPEEMEEAARLDGCGEMQFVVKIVLPLSMPMLATISLFYGVGFWNSFFAVLIYINDSEKHNLTVLIQNLVRNTSMLANIMTDAEITSMHENTDLQKLSTDGVKSAGIVIFLMPMLMVYPFIQKYFVKGVMIGAIKG